MAERLGFPNDPIVVLADADRSVDDPAINALAAEGFHLVLTTSGEEALQEFLAVKPDVVVVNSDLPDMSGLSVLLRIRSLGCVPVLVLSEAGDESEAVLALEMGARDYLRGFARIRETAARIRVALRTCQHAGIPGLTAESELAHARGVLRSGPVAIDLGRREVFIQGKLVHTRPKEFELLSLLVLDAGYVLPKDRIFAHVWPEGEPRDHKTLYVHVRRLRAIVEEDPTRPVHILTIKRAGLRFEP